MSRKIELTLLDFKQGMQYARGETNFDFKILKFSFNSSLFNFFLKKLLIITELEYPIKFIFAYNNRNWSETYYTYLVN